MKNSWTACSRKRAPQAIKLFWVYAAVIVAVAVFCELTFHEEDFILKQIVGTVALFATTCIFAAMYWKLWYYAQGGQAQGPLPPQCKGRRRPLGRDRRPGLGRHDRPGPGARVRPLRDVRQGGQVPRLFRLADRRSANRQDGRPDAAHAS